MPLGEARAENRVYAVSCTDYSGVGDAVDRLLEMCGGLDRYVAPGQRVALKVNLLRPARPETAVCTHPGVVEAVARRVTALGADALIVDSPGSGYKYNLKTLERIYAQSGMADAAGASGARLNRDLSVSAVTFAAGKLIMRFEAITPVVQADVVLNLCKLKTHTFMHLTGAIKNNFGVIAGLHKPGYHAKLRDSSRFAGMLLDLCAFVAPKLSIMDAITAMEGDGPSAGTPRRVGLLLAAPNPLALDVVAAEIMGVPRPGNPVLIEAERRGLVPTRIEDVDLVGLDPAELRVPGFRLPTTVYGGMGFAPSEMNPAQRLLVPLMRGALTVRPRVKTRRCIGCGSCRDACPVGAVTLAPDGRRGERARIDDDQCIRCYCCHEMCPQGAIDLRRSLLHRLVKP